jgi:hypothetical protein
MPTQKIKCPACGFAALLVVMGESPKLTLDSMKQIQLCKSLTDHLQSRSSRARALDCPAFREELQRPRTGNLRPASSDESTEIEKAVITQDAPEQLSEEKPSGPGKPRRAKAKSEAASPDLKSTRRGRRTVHHSAATSPPQGESC